MKGTINWFYRWHRRLGVLAALPILGWCLSGLTHPLMAHFFRLQPAQRVAPAPLIQWDSSQILMQTALEQYGLDTFQQLRWVSVDAAPYYQIQVAGATPQYIHRHNGALLPDGDQQYARQLARHFLGDTSSAITQVELVTQFGQRYKFINRFLPVYRVAFDRPDGMAVYVHTPSSRLGTLNDDRRRQYLWLFSQLHNWDFLTPYPKLKLGLMLFWLIASGFVALSGLLLYGVWWKQWKGQQASKSRRWHRRLGLLVSLSALAFVFSGGYHALAKQQAKPRPAPKAGFPASHLQQLPALWATFNGRGVYQITLARLEGHDYFQVDWEDPKVESSYFGVHDLQIISQGEERYALALAKRHAGLPDGQVDSVRVIQKFGGEYGFINKRLPVHAVHYNSPQQHAVYVETRTGDLATIITNTKRKEALIFLLLHKYHWLDPLGKQIRDGVIVLLLLGIAMVHVLGLILWWRTRAVN